MKKQDAEHIITGYMKPVYGFALKRCKNMQDAEDLSQEIILKAFRALLVKEDIGDVGTFIWTIAHNTLSNYYRDAGKFCTGGPVEELAEVLSDEKQDLLTGLVEQEEAEKLQSEIAYLSKLQRRIVIAFYYENKKQEEIAKELSIPVGTVKWHLFEAKKDLKRGMETMRTASELKFNPIRFSMCGTNGSEGTKGSNSNFFRSPLTQNIAYAVWKEAKTVNEIAEALGVSPVYVESEAEYLEEYGFLTMHGEKYLCNILIEEGTTEINQLRDTMYEEAAKLFANELYEELVKAEIWNHPDVQGGFTEELSFEKTQEKDKNFFLWALIPYITACSNKAPQEASVSFEDAATLRPDGGHNICYATIDNEAAKQSKYYDSMKDHFYGACWNQVGKLTLWQVDSEWSEKRIDNWYHQEVQRALISLNHMVDGEELSKDEYAYLAEKGLIKTLGSPDGLFKAGWQCVWLEGAEIKSELLALGDRLRKKYQTVFQELQKPYVDAVRRATPKHLHTMLNYGLQYTFYWDGWFILHCMKTLVESGKLLLPKEHQRKALTTIIIKE